MSRIETNIFPITNLSELSSRYRMCRLVGLHKGQDEYYPNRQQLQKNLSFKLRRPVIVIEREGKPYLVVPDDVATLPAEYPMVRTVVRIEPLAETIELDYTLRTPENNEICLRFLSFIIQSPLHQGPRLWQPNPGRPFFEQSPASTSEGIDRFLGFRVRPVITPDGGIGLCIDPTACYVHQHPLPVDPDHDDFARTWKGTQCIYHCGDQWYQVRLDALDDRTVSEYTFSKDGKLHTLSRYLLDKSHKPVAAELADLPGDAAVVIYRNNRGEQQAAPAPLCYPVADTEDVGKDHHKTIIPAFERKRLTCKFAGKYVRPNLETGIAPIRLATELARFPKRIFTIPDLEFGQSTILSVRGTVGARQVTLKELGKTRLSLLTEQTAGFFLQTPLDHQYFFLPQSVYDSWGGQFLKDFTAKVDRLLPQPGGYSPTVIPYDDRRSAKTFIDQGRAILGAVDASGARTAYGVVMLLHRSVGGKRCGEDQLAALVTRELYDRFDLRVSVIHSETGRASYREVRQPDGRRRYERREHHRGKLAGYLRSVAINKVLLTNERWPFVLATPLHADLIIGIDVKNHSCGLLIVGRNGSNIRFVRKESKQKEQLLHRQIRTYLIEVLSEEAQAIGKPIRNIVIHRDGHTWPSELKGAREALARLKRDGVIAADATLTVLEIPKYPAVPLRMFDFGIDKAGKPWTNIPQVGIHHIVNDSEGYLCATGRPFLRQGTAHPLYVRRVEGPMPIEDCLKDIYFLTALTWTRPEDCTRYPITIKLNDRYLAEDAGNYDADALEFSDDSDDEEAA